MLTFFPNPYPDELLYSTFARYHVRSGNISPKITMKELFNTTGTTATVEIPCNLNTLIDNMPSYSKYTVDELIYNNTLYSFYDAFLPIERAKKTLKTIKQESGGSLHTRIGIMASKIESPKYLRYCPKCNAEDKAKYGEFYWHRLFQISGVLVCPRHGVMLSNSTVPFHGLNKHEYIPADTDNCKYGPHEIEVNKNELDKLILIAKDIGFILNHRFKNKRLEWFNEQYKGLLIEKGFATVNGRVDQKEFVFSFINYYGENILKLLQSNVDYNFESNWLSSIVRKPRKVFQPISHLLIIRFLLGSVKKFFETDYIYKPFGRGPWPCLNAASIHYHENVIRDMRVTYDTDTKQPVGTFYCECGFVYSRRGPDNNDSDKYHIGRIKNFGAAWEGKLKELAINKNLSLREISRRLNVDVKTVKKYEQKLGFRISEEDVNKEVSEFNNIAIDDEEFRKRYRNIWINLQNNNKDISKKELRNLNKAAYMWLYRNDKEWLNENSPLNRYTYINNRVNWAKRDNEILIKVKKEIKKMLKINERPIRITISRIGKEVGILALLEKHIDKLPKTKIYLQNKVEDIETYQIRKVKWATYKLNTECKELKSWKVLRLAGIKSNCSQKVLDSVEDEINYYLDLIETKEYRDVK